MVDTDTDRELTEKDPNAKAREALARYHDTDQSVPLGGLPIKEYERIRYGSEELDTRSVEPHLLLERAWLHVEYAIAMIRGAISPDSEEKYTQGDIAAAFTTARTLFVEVMEHPDASLEIKMKARWAKASLQQQEEVLRTRIKIGKVPAHLGYLQELRHIGQELLAHEDELTSEGHTLADTLAVQMIVAEYTLDTAWLLPPAPRQPWHLSAFSGRRTAADLPIVVGQEGPKEYAVIPLEQYNDYFGGEPHATLRALLEMNPGFSFISRKQSFRSDDQKRGWAMKIAPFSEISDLILATMDRQSKWQKTHGILSAEEQARQTSVEEIKPRDMFPDALWYLTECTSDTPLTELDLHIKGLETMRRVEGLTPDEQRILGWMQLEQAVMMANAANDEGQLDVARSRFSAAMNTFMRAAKGFDREHMPGDMIDALLAIESVTVYRALFTSPDKYAVKKAVSNYPQKVAELLELLQKNRAKIHGSEQQLTAYLEVVARAGACLLQSAATEEAARHLVVQAPNRLGSPHLMAFLIDCTERVARYDINTPVGIMLVDGVDIKLEPGRVSLGRQLLTPIDKPFGLVDELVGALRGPSKAKTKSGKGSKPALPTIRSEATNDLSTRLGDMLFDAAEAADNTTEE